MHALSSHAAVLEAGGELVTATPRQARALQAAFGRAAAKEGRAVWSTPRITPYRAWLGERVRVLDDRPQLLEPYAAERLWQQIVRDSEAGAGLMNVRAAAAEAARAWALAHEWQLPLQALAPTNPDEQAFYDWAREFRRRTAALGVLDGARLAALYAQHATPGGAAPIGFHGFAEQTPARAALCSALQRGGAVPQELTLTREPVAGTSLAPATAGAECEAIAGWLAAQLRREPAARLVVLLPELGTRAASLARLLDDRLAPELLTPGAADARAYAFGVEPALAEQAVVEAALGLIGLGAGEVELLALGRLLRSPYVPAGEGEAARRAQLDAALRAAGVSRLALHELPRQLRAMSPAQSEFALLLEAVRGALAGDRLRPPAVWADAFQRALRVARWPLGRALGPREYEAARALSEAVASLSALAPLLPTLSFAEARAELQALVAATPFGGDNSDPQVLVLEGLEDPALPCSGLWVAGLNADRFPGSAQPTPLLPLPLQRACAVPGSSPALMLAAARRALGGWRRAAPQLVLSAPRQDDDGPLVRSALVPQAVEPPPSPPVPGRAAELRAAARLESWNDAAGLPALAGTHLQGGVKVLELQSRCPFRAGAELRLGAEPLATPQAGLSARLRGILAHEALKEFWSALDSHAALCALDEAGREQMAHAAVERARHQCRPPLPGTRLVALECEWLVAAIVALAALETRREPFVVQALEQKAELEVGGYTLNLRLDRVDRLADGSMVLLDYKTGSGRPRRWIGPRPDAMQLAAYALARAEPTCAVALALLPPAHTAFIGLAARAAVLPAVGALADARPTELRALAWPDLLTIWRRLAAGLAQQHAQGTAAVDPAPGACDHCRLPGLCRIGTVGTDEEDLRAGEEAGDD